MLPSGLLQRMDVQTGGSSAAQSSDNVRGDQEPVELAEVVVTGTRIQHPNVTSANPITSISGEQASLRGMDPTLGTRTLTLIDGRRTVSTSNQADVVDMNSIPSNMRQRMGVVPGGDQFAQFDTNPVRRAAEEPVSTFSVDVDTTSYSFARRALNYGTLPAPDAVRAEEMINYFDYAWPAAGSRRQPFRPTVTVSDSPWGEGRKLIHVGIKGYELPARGKPDVNLVLLLDVSGSMNAPDRLPLATRSMKLLLDSLKPTDTVAIVVYAGAAGQVLAPTQVRDRETIEQALDSLRAGGSTAGAQGIRLAYQLAERNFREGGVNRILLATDGDFNVGVSDPDELKRIVERERAKGIFLSVLGFGRGNYRDDIAQALAQNGNGAAAYIDTLSEARKVLVHEATSSLFTIAGDVKIQVEFNPATVAEYRLVGYETRALNREDFNNDKVDAGDVGSGSTVTAIYEIAPVGSNATLMDERRYAGEPAPATVRGSRAREYGFVKIRYKLPGEDQSQLIEQSIRMDAGVPLRLRQDVAFSTAVAGYAQLLRGGQYTGTLDYDDVLRQARSATGADPFGHRAEFLDLVRSARDVQRASGKMAD
jgi:Ca-activated chloride channel family protein